MEFLSDFLSWAWARHHNVLSWYIRPMFIIPFIYFAYKQNWKGLVLTVIALFTSMFWFPAPATVDPAVEQFLQAEKDYILGDWTFAKVLASLDRPRVFLLPRIGILEAFLVVGCGGHQPRRTGQGSHGALFRAADQVGRYSSLL